MGLLFSAEARRQFDPIAQQFGLICVTSSEQGLRYENENVFMGVNFDNGRSYELGVEIGKQHTQYLGPFSLAEILKLRGIQEAKFVSGLINSDQARLPEALSKLVRLTREHASDFLRGMISRLLRLKSCVAKKARSLSCNHSLDMQNRLLMRHGL